MIRRHNRTLGRVPLGIVLSLALGASTAHADQPSLGSQKTFQTPEAAGAALAAAARAEDKQALVEIFGPGSEDLASSGDPVADERLRARFLVSYDEKHSWEDGPDGVKILTAGESDWPLPIPLVDTAEGWRFDTKRGADEILNRRIGRNELGAIQACLAFQDAEQEYYERKPLGQPARYAQFIASGEGKKDGLYWREKEGEEPSPLGSVFASARAQGYDPKQGVGRPFHGYVYRVLTKQGDAAHGGAMDYVVDGAMTKGFALLASPAKYGSSGVMTFLINQSGVIYEKDLGAETSDLAMQIVAFDPDESWDVVSAAERVPPSDS